MRSRSTPDRNSALPSYGSALGAAPCSPHEAGSANQRTASWRVWAPILLRALALGIALLGLAGIGSVASRAPELSSTPLARAGVEMGSLSTSAFSVLAAGTSEALSRAAWAAGDAPFQLPSTVPGVANAPPAASRSSVPMSAMPVPTTASPGPTSTPGGPTTAPPGPTSAPGGPTSAPGGPTTAPGGPTSAPGGPTTAPGGPTPLGPTTGPTSAPGDESKTRAAATAASRQPAPNELGGRPCPESAADPERGRSRSVAGEPRVVLNQANATELQRLPGVGAKRAEAIVQLRERLGRFRRPGDLLRIKGIGPRTLERMLPHLVLD